MGRHIEPLTGGLVTDRDPVQLSKGQLSYIRNMVYKQGATSLRTAPGRLQIATASTADGGVYGLRDLQFDNGMHYLVAGVEDMYRSMNINVPGTFVTVTSGVATGKNIEAVQFRNRYYVLNGATSLATSLGTNTVMYQSSTASTTLSIRQHGVLPVLAAPTYTTANSAVSAFAMSPVTGYYEYWLTEVTKGQQDGASYELESAFSNETGPTTVPVLTSNTIPTIYIPGPRNSTTTHWRVYRSPKKDTEKAKKFPVGYLAGEFATSIAGVTITSFNDSNTYSASASAYPTAFNSGGDQYAQMASASSMQSDNGVYASAVSATNALQKTQGCYGFSLSSLPKGVIMGIKVEIQAYVSSGTGPATISVFAGVRDPISGGWYQDVSGSSRVSVKSVTISSTSSAAPSTVTVGSETDAWLQKDKKPFTDEDFRPGQFMIAVSPSVFPSGPVAAIGIDYVKMTIYYGGGADSQVVYPTVTYDFGGVQAQIGRNFPPPSAKTGDIINEQLVLNDQSNPSLIRYSYPGEPDYFPPAYFLDFETPKNDVVQCIRTVNERLIVGLDNQLWRVNYLPSERDASFDRGKAIDNISGQYGIVNPMCATTITIEGQAETLAFVSNFGLHTTDGYNIITRSKCLNWVYSGSSATPIALLNDVENRCLRIFYRDSSDPDRELCLWASYERSDIDAEGNFKFSGPVSVANYVSAGKYGRLETAWNTILSDGSSRLYMGYSSATAGGGGRVWREDDEANGTIPGYTSTYQYRTRRMFLNGIGSEWMVDDMYGYCGTYTGAPLLTYTFDASKTNQPVSSNQQLVKSITLGGQMLHRVSPKISVEGLMIYGTMTYPLNIDYGQESLVIGSKNLGYEDSGL